MMIINEQFIFQYTTISCCLIVGGLSLQTQAVDLKKRPDIVICTPGRMNRSQLILGRMIDHVMNTMSVELDDIEVIVLDEEGRL